MKFEIGRLAGEIWHFLKENGRADINQVKKDVLHGNSESGSNIMFFSSIGWLLKENKIVICEEREGTTLKTFISLK
ncbi:winged helix-turn-helix domain-containing protein [bacterium]|nr:winged helix-turn-helix domain-containing protein [bacterium]